MSTQILFIRHGETERLAHRLADEAQQGARLDAIYSSDLQRAQQTAQPIAHVLGLPLQLREGLRERSYGAFQGYDRDEIAERYPDEYERWQSRDAGFAPPEGESMRTFYHRVMDAITPIVAAHPGGRVACVAHGGVLDCVYRFARDLSLEVPRDYALLNTSVNVVDFEGGEATVKSWADVSHLDAPSEDDTLRKIVTPGL
jgi:2,3-bisphosphoglycerate-dependent phosphoglycerate mutase